LVYFTYKAGVCRALYNVVGHSCWNKGKNMGNKKKDKNKRADNTHPLQCPYLLDTDDLIRVTHATLLENIHKGGNDHYQLANKLAERRWRSVFLMQRSSSMILGPETGRDGEADFYRILLQRIKEGVEFRHIVSLEGIFRHLQKRHSKFSDIKDAFNSLTTHNWKVGIEGPVQTWYFKKIPDREDDMDIKPDRQARVFLVEFAGKGEQTEGIIVLDLGGTQFCLHLKGPKVKDLMNGCHSFYDGCQNLYLHELREVVGQYL
jgi:hypothetical protein